MRGEGGGGRKRKVEGGGKKDALRLAGRVWNRRPSPPGPSQSRPRRSKLHDGADAPSGASSQSVKGGNKPRERLPRGDLGQHREKYKQVLMASPPKYTSHASQDNPVVMICASRAKARLHAATAELGSGSPFK